MADTAESNLGEQTNRIVRGIKTELLQSLSLPLPLAPGTSQSVPRLTKPPHRQPSGDIISISVL